MRKYSWSRGSFKGNVQKVGEELETIDNLTNENVLEYAKNNVESELHKCFEWDDTKASEKYRLIQATHIISSISFVIEEKPIKRQKIYFSIKTEESEVKKFKNIKDILENDDEYSALCDRAKKDIERCKNNYYDLIRKNDLKEIVFEIYKNI